MRRATWILWLVLVSANVMAAPDDDRCERRCALVIGNADYTAVVDLANPVRDAMAIEAALEGGTSTSEDRRFETELVPNATLEQMKASLESFANRLAPQAVALFYYAGHAVQHDGSNYLVPVDAIPPDSRAFGGKDKLSEYREWLDAFTLPLASVLRTLDRSGAPLRIILLDACRDDPFAPLTRSLGRPQGLAESRARPGTIIAYATQPDNVALDGAGDHSPYTEALRKRIKTPQASVGDMLNLVGNDVLDATNGFQQPWVTSSPIPTFCFAGCSLSSQDEALVRLAESALEAVRARDIAALEIHASLSEREVVSWQRLFDGYERFEITVADPVHDAGAVNATIDIKIERALSVEGQWVFPADIWGRMTLRATRGEGGWLPSGLDSGYLNAAAGTSIDILAPVVDADSPTLRFADKETVTIDTVVHDDTDIEAAALYFRDGAFGNEYRSSPLEPNAEEAGHYSATLFMAERLSNTLDAYVEAIDIAGNRVQHPRAERPAKIALETSGLARSVTHSKRRWYIAAIALIVAGVLLTESSGDEGSGDTRPVRITTPLP